MWRAADRRRIRQGIHAVSFLQLASPDDAVADAGLPALGTERGGHHLTNVGLHTVNVVLLFLVLSGMTGAFWRSAFVAALFACTHCTLNPWPGFRIARICSAPCS